MIRIQIISVFFSFFIVGLYSYPLLVLFIVSSDSGRATFEGALRAEFAEKFAEEKEGAVSDENYLSPQICY